MRIVSSKNSQAGFSLVELMVVVAIIGILASLAIPNIGKYMAKARQSEAKSQLSSLYTAEKAFFAEYNIYDNRFGAVGYAPDGKVRYNTGFSGGVIATAANGYTTIPAIALTSTKAVCGVDGAFLNGCSTLRGATNLAPPDIVGADTAAATFVAQSIASIHASSGANDTWSVNENKNLINTVDGIQ